MDAAHGGGDTGEPAVHGSAGVEPAAHRLRPGRPGQHRAGAPPGAAVEPARRVGDLRPPCSPGDHQLGRVHRRPGRHRPARPGGPGDAAVPAGRAAGLREVRAAPGVGLVQRQARLPVPPRLYQRHRPQPGPPGEPVRPRGPDPAPARRPGHLAVRRQPFPARHETSQRSGHGARSGCGADRPAAGGRRHAHLRPGHRGFPRSGQSPSARQLAKVEPSRRLRSACAHDAPLPPPAELARKYPI